MNITPTAEDSSAMNALFGDLMAVIKNSEHHFSYDQFEVIPVVQLAAMMAAAAGEWPADYVGECLKDFAVVLQKYQQRANKAKAANNKAKAANNKAKAANN